MPGEIQLTITAASPELIDDIAKRVIEILNINTEIVSVKKEPTYSVREVAEICGKTSQTIGHHIRKQILIASKPGRDYIVTQSNLNKYLNGE